LTAAVAATAVAVTEAVGVAAWIGSATGAGNGGWFEAILFSVMMPRKWSDIGGLPRTLVKRIKRIIPYK
jgi:hypothetical protein